MVPQAVFKNGPVGFVSHWLIALGVTPFLFLAVGVPVVGRAIKARLSSSTVAAPPTATADSTGKDRKSNQQQAAEVDAKDLLVRGACSLYLAVHVFVLVCVCMCKCKCRCRC